MLTNLAERAETLNYTCPQLTDKVGIQITGGRHLLSNMYRQSRLSLTR